MKRPEEDSEEPLKVVDPQHADWLVKHRAATQHTSAKLYRLLREHPDRLEDFSAAIQLLVSISFSLWRSAFLSDKTGYMEDTNNSAVKFMSEMLENNAIAYTQERKTKDWTFNYYAANARYRLKDLKERWPNARFGPLIPSHGEQDPKNRWEFLQRAYEKAVDHFERRLRPKK